MTRTELLKRIADEETGAEARALAVRYGIRPSDLPATAGETITKGKAGYRWVVGAPEDLPTARTALRLLVDTVRAEDRTDVAVSSRSIWVDPESGWLAWAGGQRPYLRRAYSQLCSTFKTRPETMSRYQLSIPPARRAIEFDHVNQDNEDRNFVLRFRRAAGETTHHIFAVVSEDFRAWDPDAYGQAIMDNLGDLADSYRAAVSYRGTHASIHLVALNKQLGIHATVRIDSADDGSQAIWVSGAVTLSDGSRFATTAEPIARIHHRWDEAKFQEQTTAAIKRALEYVEPWIRLWTERSAATLPVDPETALARLAGAEDTDKRKRAWLRVKGEDGVSLTRKLTEAWGQLEAAGQVKPTQAGLAHCVAAAAHLVAWESPDAQSELEQLASALLRLTPATLTRLLVPPQHKAKTQGLDVANERLGQAILDRRERAAKWQALAAQAESDEDRALAQERAELNLIEADQIEETGLV